MVESPDLKRLQVLIEALDDTHVAVVWNASRDLARLGTAAAAALPALSRAAMGHDPTSRLWARFAIAKITGDTEKYLPQLIADLKNKKLLFPGMVSAALAGFGSAAVSAVPLLIDELSEANPEYRWSAAGALANIGLGASEAVPALIRVLNDADEKVRWYAAWALGEINDRRAVAPLIELLEDVDDDVRGYAARSIARIGGDDARAAIPGLESMLVDPNPNIAQTAAECIQKISASEKS